MAKYLNIEVGDSTVKVCLTEKKKNSVTLKKAFMIETPVGTAADGMVSDPGLLAGALTPKLHENGMSGVKHVIFTLVSGKIATREVMLPPIKENRIKQVIEANTADYFPVDISRYLVSYGMLKTINEGKDAGSHLMALAAPLQFLDGYIKLAERMNLDIQGIDFGGNSQFQVLKAIGTGKVIMCVAVTENHTCITIAKGDRLILQRMLPWGGDDFNRIVGGISRSMDFFNSSRWSSPLDDIILAGTCANTAGLREAVSNALSGADVFTLEEYLTEFPNPGLLGSPALITQYITAFGSAFAPVDLIPEKYKATKERKKSTEHGIFGAVVIFVTCVAAGIIMSVSAVLENNRLKNELEEIEREITAAAAAQSEHRNYIVYRNAERGFVELEEAVLNRNSGLVKFFEELEEKMPSDILLMSAVCSNESVIMNLRVPSLEAAAMTITQFGTFESIQALEISALTQGLDEAGFPFYSFTINCLYDKPVVPERQTARDSDGDTDESGEE